MWIYTFAPEWAIHAILGLGFIGLIAGFLLGAIPFIKQYAIPIRVISFVVFLLGVYLQGGLSEHKEWKFKIKEAELAVEKAKAESAKLNTELQAALAERDKAVSERGKRVIEKIDRWRDRTILQTVEGPEKVRVEEVIKYIESCPVPRELLELHNEAIRSKDSEVKK